MGENSQAAPSGLSLEDLRAENAQLKRELEELRQRYEEVVSENKSLRSKGNLPAKVFVRFAADVPDEELQAKLAEVGTVVACDLAEPRASVRSAAKRHGTVQFSTPEEAVRARELLNGTELGGQLVIVREDRGRPSASGRVGHRNRSSPASPTHKRYTIGDATEQAPPHGPLMRSHTQPAQQGSVMGLVTSAIPRRPRRRRQRMPELVWKVKD